MKNGETFSSTNELLNKVYSICPPGTSECDVEAAPATPSAAGGAKNKKRRTTRRRHRPKASRRKASRRSTSKK
jgi:hypothetical protein